jgi:hypothetical protein
MKKIVACGCSLTYGGNWSVKTNKFNRFLGYADKLGNILESEVINLSRPASRLDLLGYTQFLPPEVEDIAKDLATMDQGTQHPAPILNLPRQIF